MIIRRLTPADASVYQALRLTALHDEPTAFGSSHEEEKDFAVVVIEERLTVVPDRGVIGAFDGNTMVGMVGLGRESRRKLAHKAFVWGMYVAPQARGQGLGRALLLEALALARSAPGIRQVNLCVNAGNAGAIRLYQSLGFQAFGQESGAMLIQGELHDELHMALQIRDGCL